jgi:hypothetical protein
MELVPQLEQIRQKQFEIVDFVHDFSGCTPVKDRRARSLSGSDPLGFLEQLGPASVPSYKLSRQVRTVTDLWKEWTVGLAGQPSVERSPWNIHDKIYSRATARPAKLRGRSTCGWSFRSSGGWNSCYGAAIPRRRPRSADIAITPCGRGIPDQKGGSGWRRGCGGWLAGHPTACRLSPKRSHLTANNAWSSKRCCVYDAACLPSSSQKQSPGPSDSFAGFTVVINAAPPLPLRSGKSRIHPPLFSFLILFLFCGQIFLRSCLVSKRTS